MSSYYEKIIATGEVKCIDEEIPFEIPKGWEWCRLRQITSLLGDGIHGTPEYDPNGEYYFVNGNNLQDKKIVIKPDTKKVSREEYLKYKKNLNKHTVLVSINGTLGNIGFYNDEPIMLGKSACYFNLIVEDLKEYVYILLQSPFFMEYTLKAATGTTIKNVSLMAMNNLLIPLPPLCEQNRIVDRMTILDTKVKQYQKQETCLRELNNNIYSILKKSILQDAIQGKLVPQIAEEGTAEELLAEIHKEKERLVKEGKLKKSALTDSIIFKGDDNKYYERINEQIVEIELPFEYPNSWVVLRLKDICQLTDGEKRTGKGICLDAKYLRGKSSAAVIDKGKFVYAGDNIILVDGENSGEVFSVPQDGYMGSTFKQLWLSSVMWKPYILAFILFYKEELKNSKRGAAIPHLNKELFYNLPIGIPPFAEQQRIAERITELSQLLK